MLFSIISGNFPDEKLIGIYSGNFDDNLAIDLFALVKNTAILLMYLSIMEAIVSFRLSLKAACQSGQALPQLRGTKNHLNVQ